MSGEIGEIDALFGEMGDARSTFREEKDSKRQHSQDQEEEKERGGLPIRERATKPKTEDVSADGNVAVEVEFGDAERTPRKWRSVVFLLLLITRHSQWRWKWGTPLDMKFRRGG